MEIGSPDITLFDPRSKKEIERSARKSLHRKMSSWDGDGVWVGLDRDKKTLNKEVLAAREASIKFGDVEIIPVAGIHRELFEYLGEVQRLVWEFEPNPNMEKRVVKKISVNEVETKAFHGNEKKIWPFLEKAADLVSLEIGKTLDLKDLTPYEAILIVERLVKDNLNYEHSILHDVSNMLSDETENLSTGKPDILDLAKSDPKKFKKESGKLSDRIDSMSADKLMEYKFGVCRHIAALSQKVFHLLKEKQEGLKMNGSYLVYHSESVGEQKDKKLIERHAYNVLIQTMPSVQGGWRFLCRCWIQPGCCLVMTNR